MLTQQSYKTNYRDKFYNNKASNNMFPTGTLSLQVSQPIRSSKDMFVSIDIIKCILGKTGERYSFKKKLENHHDNITLSESSVNEVMEVVMTC